MYTLHWQYSFQLICSSLACNSRPGMVYDIGLQLCVRSQHALLLTMLLIVTNAVAGGYLRCMVTASAIRGDAYRSALRLCGSQPQHATALLRCKLPAIICLSVPVPDKFSCRPFHACRLSAKPRKLTRRQ